MNVVLKKNTSGAWEHRKKPGITSRLSRLSAWQRLWLVASAGYLLLLIPAGYLLAPSQSQIERAMILAVTEVAKKQEGLAFAGQPPSQIFEAAQREGLPAWISQVRRKFQMDSRGDAELQAIDRKYREELSSLPQRHLRLCINIFIAWLLPVLLLYLAGYLVDWVSRGRRDGGR